MTSNHVLDRPAPRTGRRLAAILGLLLVVLGPPALLLALVGNPLEFPAGLRSGQALSSALDDASLLWLLAIAVWITYAHLLSCLIAQGVQISRGRTITVPVPGFLFGANTLLASHLIAALLLPAAPAVGLTPALARTAHVTTGTTTDLTTAAAGDTAHLSTHPAPPVTTAVAVSPTDAPAGPAVGAGLPECRVLPPHGRHHDTLWDIAERHLGDGTRWRDIYALNEHRVMPDGQRLTHASLIRPGWVLRLPADARHLDSDAIAPAPQHAPSGAGAPATLEVTPPHEHAQLPVDASPELPAQAHDREAAEQAVAPEPAATQAPTQPPTLSPTRTPPSADASHPNTTAATAGDAHVVELTLGSLTLGSLAVLAALTRRRKVAGRRRPLGVRTIRPAPELTSAEARLRRRARQAQDIADTLRLALLIADKEAADNDSPLDIRAVWEHPDGSIELVLADPPPAPAPFAACERGWLLTAEGQRYLFAVRRTDPRKTDRAARLAEQLCLAPDPLPLLLPVGEHQGSACLINLEPLGLISLVGDNAGQDAASPSGTAVVSAWAHALAGAPWTDAAALVVPATWQELAIGHERLRALDLEAAALHPLSASDRAALAPSTRLDMARRRDVGPARLLQPTLLLGHDLQHLSPELLDAAIDPLDPIVILLNQPHPAAHSWRLSADGTLTIPGIADRLVPLSLDHLEQFLQLRLLEHAQDPPHAAPIRQTPNGDPEHDETVEGTPDMGSAAVTIKADDEPTAEDERAGRDPVAGGATAPETRAELAPSTGGDEIASAASWSRAVEVAVLGPLEIHGAAGPQPPRQQALEMLVYLSLHRQPLTLESMSEAIWPDRTYNARTVQNRLGDLRRYLGEGLVEKLPGNRYRLADLVVTDWQRFTHLADGSREQQQAALALVRGTPFAQTHLDWYHLDGLLGEIEAAIVDLAVTVGQRALKASDFATAKDAARAGLLGCPYDERLYRLGMQAAAAQGATAEVRQLRNQLAWILQEEIEPDDAIQPATEALYEQLREHDELTRYRQGRRA